MIIKKKLLSLVLFTAIANAGSNGFGPGPSPFPNRPIQRVLLISVDGMHAVDYLNCSKGLSNVNGGLSYCPNIATLGETGVNYQVTSTSKPSDSFPGLMAIVTGGTPRTFGAFYDVAYDRSLAPPAKTTGNGVAAGNCVVGTMPGTRTEYEEGIDIDQSKLNGGAPGAGLVNGGIASIDPARLVRDPQNNCLPVYPWNFVRTNTIFGVIHAAGGYTAWSDKHPSYSSVSGPGNGKNVDDYFSPDINSLVVPLPGYTLPDGRSCANVLDPSQTGSWTDSFENVKCYDNIKVDAILNEINGRRSDGSGPAPVPTLFGMNFQAVSVGQKLIEKNVGTGGYVDGIGTPTTELLREFQFVDESIGKMITNLKDQGLFDSTLIIITAKHGQSPIDPNLFFPIPGHSGMNGETPATLLANLLPYSESPLNPNGIGPTEDDISLLWLKNSANTDKAVKILEENKTKIGLGQIFWGPAVDQMFNPAGYPPFGDPRTPDIIVTPNVGVIYTGSTKKLSEHGGFAHDDTNVIMLVSNPYMQSKSLTAPVTTSQVAPTILKALGLDPKALDAVVQEGTQPLPELNFNY